MPLARRIDSRSPPVEHRPSRQSSTTDFSLRFSSRDINSLSARRFCLCRLQFLDALTSLNAIIGILQTAVTTTAALVTNLGASNSALVVLKADATSAPAANLVQSFADGVTTAQATASTLSATLGTTASSLNDKINGK